MTKQRLDMLLVERGLAVNRNKAQALILVGEVTVDGKAMTKAGSMVSSNCLLELKQKARFVSRGGVKLAHALDVFHIDVHGKTAMDIGASTGGFSDCLLQYGAARVYAIDVGYGQLDYTLRQDERVVVLERTNVHFPFSIPEKVDLSTIDVSFISLTKVIPNIIVHLKTGGFIIALLKPQFEALRGEVGKGGVIKDPLVHAKVIGRFLSWAVASGLRLKGLEASPIAGAEGNKEYLLLLSR